MTRARFEWVCVNGCGVCTPKRVLFKNWVETDAYGNEVLVKTTPMLVSGCCRTGMMMWDNNLNEEVTIAEGHIDRNNCV